MTLRVLYFAGLRERIGTGAETVDTPVTSALELVGELRARSDAHAAVFENLSGLRIAIDQELAEFDSPLNGAAEVAFFPPMTGG